jgi:transposase
VFVLKSGIPWEMLPQELGCGSGMSCWRRLRDWQCAGVWERLHHVLLQRLQDAGQIDWERASLDSASVPAPGGGEQTGKDPTNRGKLGTKHHVVVDRAGLPLSVTLSGANVHDSKVLEEVVDAIPPLRLPGKSARTTAQASQEAARGQGL